MVTLKSDIFTIGLLDQYHLFIPNKIAEPFAKAKQLRVKVKATFKTNTIEFYAAIKKDKNTDDYKMMFGKRLQKELGVFLNDYFEMQLLEDTSKYGVDMPEELDAVFKSELEAFEIFESLTAGKKRSIIYTVIRIKNSQTRIDKALLMCENLKRGETNPMHLFKS
ncbi:YdeI/OmpD-associated family protein [uncultured Psychroserpens sp.]|uniref:YdeI/OmpD-associated family protein n=1 Tax=uncultured Psychroserpens sp. TaxID=255436 RepID=UPI0026284566|nr:YdeI/OmpD-associated family protein [uncultured Psychroserpens sp.]